MAEPTSKEAKSYQKRITDCSPLKELYVTNGTVDANFDGYRRGVLLEAKYYTGSIRSLPLSRLCSLLNQATRQTRLAKAAGLPLEWHVASPEAAQDFRQMFKDNRVTGIRVRYTRP